MKIDFVLGIGHAGGVENMVNLLSEYLILNEKQTVRIIQLIDSKRSWVKPNIPFTILSPDTTAIDGSTLRNFYDFYEKNGYPDVIVAAGWPVLCRIVKMLLHGRSIPIVYWPHGALDRYGKFGNISDLEDADYFIAMNDSIAGVINDSYPDKIIHRIDNAIDIRKLPVIRNRNRYHLAYIGRIDENKNVGYIIDNLSLLPDKYELSIIGSGECESQIRRQVRSLGMENRVRFLGWKENPWEIVEDESVLIMASYSEGFSLTLIEALAVGMYAVSSKAGAACDVIENGKNGYLFDTDNRNAIADILLGINAGNLHEPDPDTCRRSAERWDIGNIGKIFMDVLISCV